MTVWKGYRELGARRDAVKMVEATVQLKEINTKRRMQSRRWKEAHEELKEMQASKISLPGSTHVTTNLPICIVILCAVDQLGNSIGEDRR